MHRALIVVAIMLTLIATPVQAQVGGCRWPGGPGAPIEVGEQPDDQARRPGGHREPIRLDGQLGDWVGRACIPDPPGDCRQGVRDLTGVWFGTNPDDPNVYFMVERHDGGANPIGILIHIDTNNDGDYSSPTDRVLAVRYQPRPSNSRVDVELWDGTGQDLGDLAEDADLGESRAEGARRVEVGVSFAMLGITAGQAIRFNVTAQEGNTNSATCDGTAEVQWSPANALGVLLVAVVAGAAIVLARRQRLLERP